MIDPKSAVRGLYVWILPYLSFVMGMAAVFNDRWWLCPTIVLQIPSHGDKATRGLVLAIYNLDATARTFWPSRSFAKIYGIWIDNSI